MAEWREIKQKEKEKEEEEKAKRLVFDDKDIEYAPIGDSWDMSNVTEIIDLDADNNENVSTSKKSGKSGRNRVKQNNEGESNSNILYKLLLNKDKKSDTTIEIEDDDEIQEVEYVEDIEDVEEVEDSSDNIEVNYNLEKVIKTEHNYNNCEYTVIHSSDPDRPEQSDNNNSTEVMDVDDDEENRNEVEFVDVSVLEEFQGFTRQNIVNGEEPKKQVESGKLIHKMVCVRNPVSNKLEKIRILSNKKKAKDVDPNNCKIVSLQKLVKVSDEITSPTDFYCSDCGIFFESKRLVTQHRKDEHYRKPPSSEGPYTCEVCKKVFEKRAAYTAHVRIHEEKKFLCSDCGLAFITSSALSKHTLVHTGKFVNVCPV